MQRVDGCAVHEQTTPRGEQRCRADAVGVAASHDVARGETEGTEHQCEQQQQTERTLFGEDPHIHVVRRQRQDQVGLAWTDADWIVLAEADAGVLGTKARGIVTLQRGSLLQEAARSGNRNSGGATDDCHEQHGEETGGRPRAATPQQQDGEHHDERNAEIEPCRARIREQHPEREQGYPRGLEGARRGEQARPDGLLEQYQQGRNQEWAEDVRVLEQRLRATVEQERAARGDRRHDREHPERRRDQRGDEVADHHLLRAMPAVYVTGKPDGEDCQIQGGAEVGRRRANADRLRSRDHVEREQRREQSEYQRRHAAGMKAAAESSNSDHQGEHRVGWRRLEPDDRQQNQPQGDGRLVADDGEPGDCKRSEGTDTDKRRRGHRLMREYNREHQRRGDRRAGAHNEPMRG